MYKYGVHFITSVEIAKEKVLGAVGADKSLCRIFFRTTLCK
jgi:hypothetical protein